MNYCSNPTSCSSDHNQLQLVVSNEMSTTEQGECSNSNGEENQGNICIPMGYRFRPWEHELLVYLEEKVRKNANVYPIIDLDVYKCEPQELYDMYKSHGYLDFCDEERMYFFSPVKRKDNSTKKNERRVVKNGIEKGYWKASTARRDVSSHNTMTFGRMACLVYNSNERKAEGKPTFNWLMKEYRLPDKMYLGDQESETALCVVYSHGKKTRERTGIEESNEREKADQLPIGRRN